MTCHTSPGPACQTAGTSRSGRSSTVPRSRRTPRARGVAPGLAPTGNSIQTAVEARLLEVLRGQKTTNGSGIRVGFLLDGGQTAIGSTRVRSEWAPKLAVGDVLLVALRDARPVPFIHRGVSAFTIEDYTLASVDSRLDGVRRPTLLDGADLDAVKKAISIRRH